MTPEQAKDAVRDVLQPRITKEKEAEAMDIIIDFAHQGSNAYRGRYNYSTNLFPEVGGVGDMKAGGGRPTPGDYYVGADGASGTLKEWDESDSAMSGRIKMTYIGAADGNMQLGVNWKIDQ